MIVDFDPVIVIDNVLSEGKENFSVVNIEQTQGKAVAENATAQEKTKLRGSCKVQEIGRIYINNLAIPRKFTTMPY